MFENQMNRNSVPMNGNHFAAILSSMFPRVMLSRMSVKSDLDRGLHAVGPLLHPPRDVDHRHARQDRRDEEVEHRLVDVERPRQVDPGVELELVLGLELLVVVRVSRR